LEHTPPVFLACHVLYKAAELRNLGIARHLFTAFRSKDNKALKVELS
jgi:hypothetical protein